MFIKDEVKYRYNYHISPKQGWLNDPNGLCWFKGKYHVFFQSNPFANQPGKSYWGHVSSENLLDWQEEDFALRPDQDYDCDGCYSGSAIELNDKLFLMYTGHQNLSDSYKESQCLAFSEDGINFQKVSNNPVIENPPEDNTNRFRDPKIWKNEKNIYAVIGGESKENRGQVNLYRMGETFDNWQYQRKLAIAQKKDGIMWECPDYFEIEGDTFLIVSPKGMQDAGINGFASVYLQGDFGFNQTLEGYELNLIDLGQDFYAPQTFWDPIEKRRIMFAWFGMPGLQEQELKKQVGALTLPRVVKNKNGKLLFAPLPELQQLRTDEKALLPFDTIEDYSEIRMTPLNRHSNFLLRITSKIEGSSYQISYQDQKIEISFFDSLRNVRQSQKIDKVSELRLFLDSGLTELFINDGQHTFTNKCELIGTLAIEISGQLQAKAYTLRKGIQ